MFPFWNRIRRLPPHTPPHKGLFTAVLHFERASYLKAVAVVAAKLAKVDGPVQRSEIECFTRLFPLEPHERAAVAPLFNLARESPDGFRPFALQLAQMVNGDLAGRRALFDCFYRIALSDGSLTIGESEYLNTLAQLFGIEEHWQALQRASSESDPYSELGVTRDISDEELRTAWRRLIREHHPDAAAARGQQQPDHARVAAINAAYRHIVRARRGKRAFNEG